MENISVSIRVRPLNRQENQEFFAWRVDGNSICQLDPTTREVDRTRDAKYGLDHVFGPEWTTRQIYEATTQSLIRKMVNGFNSTVFAYGQTSSGKTHTMRGTEDSPGLIPLAVAEAFQLIENTSDREYLIRVSYMELYNEEVNDLLAPENTKLPIHESKENGPYVCGLREDIVTSPEQVLGLLGEGEANRHIGSTKMNDQSSRSHTIFRMVVESRAVGAERDDAGAVLVSALTLVDLAGSERVAKTGAEGIRMKEGTAINKSLLTLGNVINKLSEGALATGSHIPYRDSKLTRILQPSLGGNAKTAIICAMTPAFCHVEESHSTLRFACRAKRVVNNAIVNEVLSDAAVLKRQAKEIEELKKRLEKSGVSVHVEDQINNLRAQLLRSEQEKELMRVKLQEEMTEREKAQKQAEMAKKIMFEREDAADGPVKKQSRRETWCPGKSAWAAPASLLGEAAPQSSGGGDGGGSTKQRKRSYSRLDALGSKSNANLSALQEEEEEEADDVQGPTPQRRRRNRSSMIPEDETLDEQDEEQDDLSHGLGRVMAALPSQERQVLNSFVLQWQQLEQQCNVLQQDMEVLQQEREQDKEEARAVSEAMEAAIRQRDALLPQMEQVKWQARQLEKKVDDLQTACAAAKQEKEAVAAEMEQAQAAAAAKQQEHGMRLQELSDGRTALLEQVKSLKSDLADAKAQIELRDYEANLHKAKEAAAATELADAYSKLKERMSELEALKRSVEAADDKVLEAEAKARELYECNKRLEIHVNELEGRKRAPLYQKKQEEELKAAVEKAQECECRAVEAELRVKEMRSELEAVEKKLSEVQEQAAWQAKQVAEARTELAAHHAMELQRLAVERSRIQEKHSDELASMQQAVLELQEQKASLAALVASRDETIKELTQQAYNLQQQFGELKDAAAEMQACMAAAQEKISHMEQAAEATANAHEAALDQLRNTHTQHMADTSAAHEAATSAVTSAHQNAVAALEATLQAAKTDAAQAQKELTEKLESMEERYNFLVKASLDESQQAAIAKADLQRQVVELSAKVAEAAGALRAKEELKEERARHKQEAAALKAELQKFQLESKTGAKGKDLAQKELDAAKKRLLEVEGKLKVVLQDKAAALADKGTLERQLKQYQGQKLIMEKTLEKKDALENKKRESIMVNLSKSKEQLNSTEERLKSAAVEIQKLQMDLTAKSGECQSLEREVQELQAANASLSSDNEKLSLEVTHLQHQADCVNSDLKEAAEQLRAVTAQLEELNVAHDQQSVELAHMAAENTALQNAKQQQAGSLQQLQQQHDELSQHHSAATKQLSELQSSLSVLQESQQELLQELAAAKAAAAAAENARVAAEGRLPEVEELQRQMTLTMEELTDLQFNVDQERAAQRSKEAQLVQRAVELEARVASLTSSEEQLRISQQEALQQLSAARSQLSEVSELYNSLQGLYSTAEQQRIDLEAKLAAELLAKEQTVQEMDAAIVEADQLRTQVEALSQCAADATAAARQSDLQHIRKLQEQVEQLQEQLAAVQPLAGVAEEKQALCHQVQQLEQQLADTVTAAAAAEQAAAQRLQQLDSQLAEATAAQAVLSQAAQRVNAIELELAQTRSQLAEAEAHATAAATMEVELNSARLQLAELQTGASAASTAEAELAWARAQLAEHQALSDAKASAVAEELVHVRALLAEAEARADGAAAKEEELGQARVQLAQLQACASRMAAVEAELAEANAQLAGAQMCTNSNNAEAELVHIKAQLAEALALAGRAAAIQAELVEARSQLAEATSRANSLAAQAPGPGLVPKAELDQALVQVDQLTQELTDMEFTLNAERATATAQLDHLRAQLQQAGPELEAQVQMLDAERITLQAQLTASAASSQELQGKLADALEQVQQLQQEVTSLLADLAAAQGEAQAAVADSHSIRCMLEAAQGEQQAKSQALTGAEEQLAAAHKALQHTSSYAHVGGDLEAANSQIAVLTEELATQRTVLTKQLQEAHQLQLQLESSVTQLELERDQLLHVIDEMSVQLASAPAPLLSTPNVANSAHEPPVQVAAHQNTVNDSSSLQMPAPELVQQVSELQRSNELLHQELMVARADVAAAMQARDAMQVRPVQHTMTTSASEQQQIDEFQSRIRSLEQQHASLEAEMSEVQAACNMAQVEKTVLERKMAHRVLELETANLALMDQLEELRKAAESTPSCVPLQMHAPGDASDSTAHLLEQHLQAQVRQLQVALDNADQAKQRIQTQLTAETEELQKLVTQLQARVGELEQQLVAVKFEAQQAEAKAACLQCNVDAASTTKQEASACAVEAETALAAILPRFEELQQQHESLVDEARSLTAVKASLQSALEQEAERRRDASLKAEALTNEVDRIKHELAAAQAAASAASAATTQAEHAEVQQYALRLQAAQAVEKRLTQELATAQQALASTELQAQELLDANTLLESQVQQLRSRVEEASASADQVPKLHSQLHELQELCCKHEARVQYLTQQAITATAEHQAVLCEVLKLRTAVQAAGNDRDKALADAESFKQGCQELKAANTQFEVEIEVLRKQHRTLSEGHAAIADLQLQLQHVQSKAASAQQELGQERAAHAHLINSLEQQLEVVRSEMRTLQERHTEALDEAELSAKQREAELNADKLSLQSQIHWLTEENQRLQQQAAGGGAPAAPPAPAPDMSERLQALETELRRAKRAEQKLQAMLYRLRKDIESAGGNVPALEKLQNVRSLEYDVDLLTQKCKRYERQLQQHGFVAMSAQKPATDAVNMQAAYKTDRDPVAASSLPLVDKENMPRR